MTDNTSKAPPDLAGRSIWAMVPVVVFIALSGLFAYRLTTGDPSKVPSALMGRAVPATEFQPVEGLLAAGEPVVGFSSRALTKGDVAIVNFWASWCAPCAVEHPLLVDLAKTSGAKLYGVNYKDSPDNARRFLGRFGNPFVAVGADPKGRGAIEWGVYGMPETFVVNGAGTVVYKHVGPLSKESVTAQLLPAIERAKQTAPATAGVK